MAQHAPPSLCPSLCPLLASSSQLQILSTPHWCLESLSASCQGGTGAAALGTVRVWGLPAAIVGKTHGPPDPWNDWSLGLFSGGVPCPTKGAGPQSSSVGVSSAMSQVLPSSSLLDLALCSCCLLEEGDRASVHPEGPGKCESGVPPSQFCLSLGSTFFSSASAPSPSSEPSQGQGWCWLACPLIGDPEWGSREVISRMGLIVGISRAHPVLPREVLGSGSDVGNPKWDLLSVSPEPNPPRLFDERRVF